METQLQEIIDRIHSEGVKSAEERGHEIITRAEKQAQEKIRHAEDQGRKIVQDAQQEAARSRAAGEAALQQAGRDLLLSVRHELEQLFAKLIRETVVEALPPEQTGAILAKLIEAWPNAEGDDLTLLLPEKDLAAIEKGMQGKLSQKLKDSVTIQPVRGVAAGFRIGSKDGASFFDLTDATLAELLAAFLNPRLAALLQPSENG